jgi:UDP-N-acetylglucosamine 1-carboxyvinyltransferase
MEYYEVKGGLQLQGTVEPQGAKNEALQVLSATLLTPEPVTISNIPDILDVRRLLQLLANLGASVEQLATDTYRIQAKTVDVDYLKTPEAAREFRGLRGSVMVMGPLLARFGRMSLPRPGGDKIGRRPIDVHLRGMEHLGASFDYEQDLQLFDVKAPDGGLQGGYMLLSEASVTGTANILMAAVLAEGETTLYNAACEPYVQQLCHMLVQMGAEIEGIGSNLLRIRGQRELGGAQHRLLADMIEVGSFIGMAAMTRSPLTITGAGTRNLGVIPASFRKLGIPVTVDYERDTVAVEPAQQYKVETFVDGSILSLSDHTWPGLTPDLLSVLLVTAIECEGTVLIHQKMFESRLFFVDKLIDMGAQIILCDPHRATVIGQGNDTNLRGISMTSPDIRAGMALLIAAMAAKGTSYIYNIEQLDRGYQQLEQRLQRLGAKVVRRQEDY